MDTGVLFGAMNWFVAFTFGCSPTLTVLSRVIGGTVIPIKEGIIPMLTIPVKILRLCPFLNARGAPLSVCCPGVRPKSQLDGCKLHPKPWNLNPKPQTLNPKPEQPPQNSPKACHPKLWPWERLQMARVPPGSRSRQRSS